MMTLDMIRKDIVPFADPGTAVIFNEEQGRCSARWTSRRINVEATFLFNDSYQPMVIFQGIEMSYRAFLSHPRMSDMLGVAGMIAQVQSANFFVPTRASTGEENPVDGDAISLLRESIDINDTDQTRIIFVTADAGAGKTEVLKHLVRQQADRYQKGEVEFLFLYVNAQGRALARLDEALATEIQDLRASRLTYHVVPALTRNGILVPLIDGFDELLGVLGYEDAFSSLRRFIDELGGRGSVVASARSTYYQREFLSRVSQSGFKSERISVSQIEIQPWGEKEFKQYMRERFDTVRDSVRSYDDFYSKMSHIFSLSENVVLKTKPFFVAKAADILLSGGDLSNRDLIDNLVDGYIERERTSKLLDKNGNPLLSRDDILYFLRLISEEMWISETRVIDGETIRVVADLAFPPGLLQSEAGQVVLERAPTMAFFTSISTRDRVEFEHEIFFAYFLGLVLFDVLTMSRSQMLSILTRAMLPDRSAVFAARRVRAAGVSVKSVVDACSETAALSSPRSAQVKENSGRIVAACLTENIAGGPQVGIFFHDLLFAGEVFTGVSLRECSFERVEFRRSDLTRAKFLDCVARDVLFQEIVVSEATTTLDISGVDLLSDVIGLKVRVDGGVKQIFRTKEIITELRKCGMPFMEREVDSYVKSEAVDLLERILKKFERNSIVWLSDPENRQIVENPMWPNLEKSMVDAGIVAREVSIAQKGTPRPALRRFYLPQQVMRGEFADDGVPDKVRDFWLRMRQRFPARLE